MEFDPEHGLALLADLVPVGGGHQCLMDRSSSDCEGGGMERLADSFECIIVG